MLPAGSRGRAGAGIAGQEVKLNSRQKLEVLFCLARATVWNQSGFRELQSLYISQVFTSFGFFVVSGVSGLAKLRSLGFLRTAFI